VWQVRQRTAISVHFILLYQLSQTEPRDGIVLQTKLDDHGNTLAAELSMGWVDPWVGSRFFSFRWVGSTTAKVLKICKDYFHVFKAQLDKIWLHQTVKFDFMADLIGTGK